MSSDRVVRRHALNQNTKRIEHKLFFGIPHYQESGNSFILFPVRILGNFRYILIPEIINMFMTNMSDPVRVKHVLVFKLNLK
jgi:hypothetical protein